MTEFIIASSGETAKGVDVDGRSVIAAMAPIPGPAWMVFGEQPAAKR